MNLKNSPAKANPPLYPEAVRRRYISRGIHTVEGWLDTLSAEMILSIDYIQTTLGISGGVGEIGVHHGKLFIVLHLTLRKGERSFAVDIFDQQFLNVDQSGRGDKEIFLANVRRWGGREDLIDMFADSSENVSADQIIRTTGLIRVFSVDGGHTERLTLHDIRLAEQVICEGGIVIVDDYFNAHWPDVSCGVSRYLQDPRATLRPFLICPNKIFLCDPARVPAYHAFFRDRFRHAFLKSTAMFGETVLIFDAPKNLPQPLKRRRMQLGDRLRHSELFTVYKTIASGRFGRALRPIAQWLFP